MPRKKRRRWSAEDKLRIVLSGMDPGVEVSELCRREGINPTQYYGGRRRCCRVRHGWTRDKQSKVLHRILEARAKQQQRTWLWDAKLGGMKVTDSADAMRIEYQLPDDLQKLPGLSSSSRDQF